MSVGVKICGLSRAQDVRLATDMGASFLGFIVEAKSARRLSVNMAADLAYPIKGIVPRVAVTVNASDALIERITEHMQPDYIQFHGDETPEHIQRIREIYGIKTIRAISVSERADLSGVHAYEAVSDLILFDAKPPKRTDARGGHGLAFDWGLLEDLNLRQDWLLAGGLTPDNVKDAVTRTNAPYVDVSSGVEASPGVKDPDKMNAFMRAVRHGG